LLHVVQDRLAFLAIELDRLVPTELVEIEVAAAPKHPSSTTCASSLVAVLPNAPGPA
jgi:hypothetical protein